LYGYVYTLEKHDNTRKLVPGNLLIKKLVFASKKA